MVSPRGLKSFCTAFLGAASVAYGKLAMPSDYGTTGLIDIPTARFDTDGTFAAAASTDERHKQFSITCKPRLGFREPSATQDLMTFFTGTGTTSLRPDCGRKSFASDGRGYP